MVWSNVVSILWHKLRGSSADERADIPVVSHAAPVEWLADGPVTTPPIDVFESDREFVVHADVPGATPERVVVSCDDRGQLSLWVKRSSLPRGIAYSIEYQAQTWHRGLTLPEAADRRAASAELANGVLTIRIPKRPRRRSGVVRRQA
jgi:HSP20 family protein